MIPKDCRYTKEHEWVKQDGAGFVKIGITEFAASSLGEITFVELPAVGRGLEQMQAFGVVEAVKAASDINSPITGEVVEVNPAVQADPEVINRSPHDEGWMIRATLKDPAELDGLLTPEAYGELVKSLEGGH